MFDAISEWEEELRRCKADKYWRVTDVNLNFDLAQTYVDFHASLLILESDKIYTYMF